MASVREAIEECITDTNSALKCLLMAIPIFLTISPLPEIFTEFKNWAYIKPSIREIAEINPVWLIISGLLLFGLSLSCTHNVINAKNEVFPSFNIFNLLFRILKGIIALAPIAFIFSVTPSLFMKTLENYLQPEILGIITFVITTIFSFCTISSFILYCKNYKIKDCYNFKLIFGTIIEVSLAIIFCDIILGLFNFIFTGIIFYILWTFKMLGSPLSLFILSFLTVLNTAIFAHCLAQIGYDKMVKVEEKDKII